MSLPDFSALVARHRAYFRTGATRSAEWREGQVSALRAMITDRAKDFHAALWTDLRYPPYSSPNALHERAVS
jgi:hypothetical protein